MGLSLNMDYSKQKKAEGEEEGKKKAGYRFAVNRLGFWR